MFTESERRVYGPYFDGAAPVYGDPFKIHRTLIHLFKGDPNSVLKAYRSENEQERYQATNELVAAAYETFGLVAFDPKTGQGCQEEDALKIVKDYLAWCDKKKESSDPMPTGLPVSDGRPEVLGAPRNVPNPFANSEGGEGLPIKDQAREFPRSASRVGLPST